MVSKFPKRVHASACRTVLASVIVVIALASPAFAAGGDEEDWERSDNAQLAPVYESLKSEQWQEAVTLLTPLAAESPDDADIQNLLGYSHRKQRQFDKALAYYNRALEIDPKHRGALEYSGELFLETDQLEKAEAQYDRLKKACPFTCAEKRMLKRAIKKYKATR